MNAKGLLAFIVPKSVQSMKKVCKNQEKKNNRVGTKNQCANHSNSVPHPGYHTGKKAFRIHHEAVFFSTVNGSCASK